MSEDFSQKKFQEYMTRLGQIEQYLKDNLDEINGLRYRREVTPLAERVNQGDLTAVEALIVKMVDFCAVQIERDPQSPADLYTAFGSFYKQTERSFQEASAILKLGIDRHPEDASLHLNVGKIYMQEAFDTLNRKDYDTVIALVKEASECVSRAYKLNPECEGGDFSEIIKVMEKLKVIAEIRKARQTKEIPLEERLKALRSKE